MAIKNARDVYTRRNEGVSIWVVPSGRHHRLEPVRQGAAVRSGERQGLPPPDLLRHPRRSGAHVMPSLPDMTTPDVAELARDAAAHGHHTAVPAPDAGQDAFFEFLLRIGDTTLILGHRVSEWCGHAPALEEDIALANVALDLIGQTQIWLGLAAEVEGKGRTADDLAYLRDAWDFRNLLLVERPNGDFGHTLMRQFLFDAYHLELLKALSASSDPRVAEIAAKAGKEVAYHLERSSDLVDPPRRRHRREPPPDAGRARRALALHRRDVPRRREGRGGGRGRHRAEPGEPQAGLGGDGARRARPRRR